MCFVLMVIYVSRWVGVWMLQVQLPLKDCESLRDGPHSARLELFCLALCLHLKSAPLVPSQSCAP